MVGTEMLAPAETGDWLLLEKDEGKLVEGRQIFKAEPGGVD